MTTLERVLFCVKIFLLIGGTLQACEEIKISQDVKNSQDARFNLRISERVAQSVMNFAHDLAVALDKNEFPNTQIFSPLSIMESLSLLQMGAYGNSYKQLNQIFSNIHRKNDLTSWKIHEEFGWLLEDVMSDTSNKKRSRPQDKWRSAPYNPHQLGTGGANTPDEYLVRVATAIFLRKGLSLRPDYAKAVQSIYKSEVTQLDFNNAQGARDYINNWVNQNTLGKIQMIIDDTLSEDTNMILANTVYFKGFWQQPFSFSFKDDYFPDGRESNPVKVELMALLGLFPFYDAKEHDCRIIGLPYKRNQSTMYLIQPNDATRLNLQKLQKSLNGKQINAMISKMEYKTATVAFPKFKVTKTLQLNEPLMRMGIEDIFNNNAADFSLIAGSGRNTREVASAPAAVKNLQRLDQMRATSGLDKPPLFVDKIVHKVNFDINEQGTVAAAATAVYMRKSGSDVTLRFDGPFMFVLRHDLTKLPLFYGVVNIPASDGN